MKKVLVVDDEQDFCRLVKRSLEAEGKFQVIMAIDGISALQLARKEKPDIILLDVMMPGMSGGEVAEALQESPATRTIPIIFVTAIVSDSELLENDGCIGSRMFIAKPVSVGELREKISIALDKK
ncbi:MAG: response regulator [Syntrophales bacterium]|jgi:CheY-like chemotaxis protein|nr:response regulator [Syntrophales bacterium]MDY0044813.1 response regulator [Syntrophales bacterium]